MKYHTHILPVLHSPLESPRPRIKHPVDHLPLPTVKLRFGMPPPEPGLLEDIAFPLVGVTPVPFNRPVKPPRRANQKKAPVATGAFS